MSELSHATRDSLSDGIVGSGGRERHTLSRTDSFRSNSERERGIDIGGNSSAVTAVVGVGQGVGSWGDGGSASAAGAGTQRGFSFSSSRFGSFDTHGSNGVMLPAGYIGGMSGFGAFAAAAAGLPFSAFRYVYVYIYSCLLCVSPRACAAHSR